MSGNFSSEKKIHSTETKMCYIKTSSLTFRSQAFETIRPNLKSIFALSKNKHWFKTMIGELLELVQSTQEKGFS